jgi:GNAT superfamily N-acetyltransferase
MPDPCAGNVFWRALRVLRDEGWTSFYFKLLAEIGYRRMVIVEHRLDDPIPEFTPRLQVRNDVLKPSELDAYLAFRPDSERREIIDRLEAGDRCFVAWREGEIVSACWAATRPVRIQFLDCDSEFARGDAYIYDKFTAPAHRGQRLGNAVRVHQLRDLRAAGFCRAVGAIVPENRVSMHESVSNGFRPVGMIRRIKIGRWQRRFLKRWE